MAKTNFSSPFCFQIEAILRNKPQVAQTKKDRMHSIVTSKKCIAFSFEFDYQLKMVKSGRKKQQ